jgi:hypothetical protein
MPWTSALVNWAFELLCELVPDWWAFALLWFLLPAFWALVFWWWLGALAAVIVFTAFGLLWLLILCIVGTHDIPKVPPWGVP